MTVNQSIPHIYRYIKGMWRAQCPKYNVIRARWLLSFLCSQLQIIMKLWAKEQANSNSCCFVIYMMGYEAICKNMDIHKMYGAYLTVHWWWFIDPDKCTTIYWEVTHPGLAVYYAPLDLQFFQKSCHYKIKYLSKSNIQRTKKYSTFMIP